LPAHAAVTVIDYYRLGEADTNALAGATVNSNSTDSASTKHLARVGTPAYSSDVSAGAALRAGSRLAVSFSGSGQYLTNTILTNVTDNFGIEAWVRPNSVSGGHTIAYNGHTGSNGWGLHQSSSNYTALFGGVIQFGAAPVATNVWTHVAVVRASGTATLYVNGIPIATSGSGVGVPAGGFAIGAPGQGTLTENFNGLIDEVRVFTFGAGLFSTNDLLINAPLASTNIPQLTMADTLQVDNNANGRANAGDTLRYTVVLRNNSSNTLTNVVFNSPAVGNAPLVGGSVRATLLARNDGPPSNSVPGNSFHGPLNTTLNVPAVSGLLSNDFVGVPAGQIASFGGGSFGGSVTSLAAGATTNPPGLGALTVNGDGSLTFVPTATFNGLVTFQYRLTNATGFSDATATLAVGVRPSATNDAFNVTGNTLLDTTLIPQSVLGNDAGSVTGISANTAPANGTLSFTAATGNFLYTPNAGFTGADSFTYTLTNGFGAVVGTVNLTVANKIWFIDGASVAGTADGRANTPFKTLAAFSAANDGAAGHPADNDTILLRDGIYTNSLTLRNGQRVFGDGTSGTLAAAFGFALAPGSAEAAGVPVSGFSATRPTIATAAGNGVNLASGNTIRGLNIASTTAGFGLSGGAVGSLTVAQCSKTGMGGALNITNSGAFGANVAFDVMESTVSVGANLSLTNVTGTLTVTSAFAGFAGSAANFAAVNISGGSVSLTYPGNVNKTSAGPAVSVSGGHTGTLIFSSTNAVVANAGTGLQFDNADGAYNFNGTNTLNGGDAGIDIVNGSGGTFTFSTNSSILNPTGPAFVVSNSTANVTYNGALTQGNSATLVGITNHSVGTVTFQTGTLTATAGTGLQFDNADGTYNFFGLVTLNGGDAGIDIVNGSGGNFTFNNAPITNPSGAAFVVSGGGGSIGHAGTITKSTAGRLVDIQGRTGGSVTLTGNLSSTSLSTGLLCQNNTGGTITFSGTSKVVNTGANPAVTLANNTGATINFTGGGLALTTTSGAGFSATGGGTVSVTTGANPNTIVSTTGQPLNVASTTIGGSGLTFQSIACNGAVAGIVLNSTGAGGLTVTGTGTTPGSGGTIQNTTGRGASFISANNITLKNMNFTSAGTTDLDATNGGLSTGDNLACNAAIHLQTVTTVTLDNLNLTGGAEMGINGNTVANFTFNNSTITDAGNEPDEDGIHFYNMSGTSVISNSTIRCTVGTPNTTGGDDHMNLQMQSGTLNLTIAGGSITNANKGSGYLFGIRGTANATITLANASSRGNFSGGIVADAFDNAIMNLTVSNSISSGNNDQLSVSAGDNSRVELDANSNTLSSVATADFVVVSLLGSAFDNGFIFDARIRNNNITVANGLTADGIVVFNAGGGAMNVAITGNTIDYAGTQRAILMQTGQDGAGAIQGTVTGNNIDIKLDGVGNAVAGILAQSAITSPTGDGASICADIGGAGALANTFTHSLGGALAAGDIRVRQRLNGTARLPGYAGSATDTAAVIAYLNGRNVEVSPSTATVETTGFSGGAACTQP